jgi:DNA-binding NarL/FixJ family response regulator
MDLQMPEMNGIDALIAIRSEFPDAKVIVLTTYVGDVQILRALKAGAHAYLLKNTLHKELLDAIRAVHAGKPLCGSRARAFFTGQPQKRRGAGYSSPETWNNSWNKRGTEQAGTG